MSELHCLSDIRGFKFFLTLLNFFSSNKEKTPTYNIFQEKQTIEKDCPPMLHLQWLFLVSLPSHKKSATCLVEIGSICF